MVIAATMAHQIVTVVSVILVMDTVIETTVVVEAIAEEGKWG